MSIENAISEMIEEAIEDFDFDAIIETSINGYNRTDVRSLAEDVINDYDFTDNHDLKTYIESAIEEKVKHSLNDPKVSEDKITALENEVRSLASMLMDQNAKQQINRLDIVVCLEQIKKLNTFYNGLKDKLKGLFDFFNN